jgi:hypothetical protein
MDCKWDIMQGIIYVAEYFSSSLQKVVSALLGLHAVSCVTSAVPPANRIPYTGSL